LEDASVTVQRDPATHVIPPDETAYWVAFRLVDIASTARLLALRDHFGSLKSAWHASANELRRVLGTRERALATLTAARDGIDPHVELARLEGQGVSVITYDDEGYPRLLREMHASPPVLFLQGQVLETDADAVAIVGTRKASSYGRHMATELGRGLAEAGVTVVSGLALGIDGVAHQAALDAGGRTIAVLGSGIHDIYPREHRNLAKRVAAQGALLSDNLPHAKPDRWNFPARNRIISGLSLGVIVVEAPEKSGALITVDFAADQGRDVFAVPGPATASTSAGCNRLIRDGARLVRSVDDVLEDLRLRQPAAAEVQQPLLLEEDERRVLNVLTSEPQHIDDVMEAVDLQLPHVAALLLTLELRQLVRNVGAQYYTRA
jgi:DNA processing protein